MNLTSSRIMATRLENLKLERVVLDRPPVALVPELDSIMGGWWYRSEGYPPGEKFSTWLEERP